MTLAYSIISSLPAFTQTSISPGLREYTFGYISALPCPFKIQHRNPSSLSIEKSLLATVFTFMFCLRICCVLPIQVINRSDLIGLSLNSFGYSVPSLSMPSKQNPRIVCLEARNKVPASLCQQSPYPYSHFPLDNIAKSKIWKYIIYICFHLQPHHRNFSYSFYKA